MPPSAKLTGLPNGYPAIEAWVEIVDIVPQVMLRTIQRAYAAWSPTAGTGTPLVATAMQAGIAAWVLSVSFLAFGQWLNTAIYRAIGADGVYYGFKLGAPVQVSCLLGVYLSALDDAGRGEAPRPSASAATAPAPSTRRPVAGRRR